MNHLAQVCAFVYCRSVWWWWCWRDILWIVAGSLLDCYQCLLWWEGFGAATAGFIWWIYTDVSTAYCWRFATDWSSGWSPAHIWRNWKSCMFIYVRIWVTVGLVYRYSVTISLLLYHAVLVEWCHCYHQCYTIYLVSILEIGKNSLTKLPLLTSFQFLQYPETGPEMFIPKSFIYWDQKEIPYLNHFLTFHMSLHLPLELTSLYSTLFCSYDSW